MTISRNLSILAEGANATGVLAVTNGGTGVTTSTGTGNNVLSASPTLTGTVTATTISSPASTALTFQSGGSNAAIIDTSGNFLVNASSVGNNFTKLAVNGGQIQNITTFTVNSSTNTQIAKGVSGMAFLRDATAGGSALVIWDASFTVVIVSQQGTIFTTSAPSATQIQLTLFPTTPYGMQALAGSTRNSDVISISTIINQ